MRWVILQRTPHQPRRSSARRCWLRPSLNHLCKMQRTGSVGVGFLSLGQADSSAGKYGRERRELSDDSACFLDDDVLTLERTKAKQPVHRDITEAIRFRLTHTKSELAIVHFGCTIDREFFLQRWARFPFACKPFICGRSLADQPGGWVRRSSTRCHSTLVAGKRVIQNRRGRRVRCKPGFLRRYSSS